MDLIENEAITSEGDGHTGGFAVHLENFEGPFDLLLQLISKHKLEVTEVALSAVTDEFIGHFIIEKDGVIKDNDSVIFLHYRTDRLYQIVKMLLGADLKNLPTSPSSSNIFKLLSQETPVRFTTVTVVP